MKHDLFNWQEVKPNAKVPVKGRVRVMCSAPGALFLEAEGFQSLGGVGCAFDLEIGEDAQAWVDAPQGVRVFFHRVQGSAYRSVGEVFTNIDRMPDESGAVAEVTRAMRMLEVERRAMLREIRAERAALVADARAVAVPVAVAEPVRADEAASEGGEE